jgi:hypothetical protein
MTCTELVRYPIIGGTTLKFLLICGRTESTKPASAASDSAYRKKLADSCDDGVEPSTGSFIELDKKDENNYVLGSHSG